MAVICKAKIINIAAPKESGGSVNVSVRWWFENSDTSKVIGEKMEETFRFTDVDSISQEKVLLLVKKKAKEIKRLVVAAENLENNLSGTYEIDLSAD